MPEDPAAEESTPKERVPLEQNPLILVGIFAIVGAILATIVFLNKSDPATETPAAEPGTSAAATSSESPTFLVPEDETAQSAELARRLRKLLKSDKGLGLVVPPLVEAGRSGRTGSGLRAGDIGAPVDSPIGVPVIGDISVAVANIPNRTGNAGFASSMRALTANGPDFVTLNETSRHSISNIVSQTPGYSGYKDPVRDTSAGGGSQSMHNAVLWRSDRWRLVDAGRFKVVDNDVGFFKGRPFVWDRYATWAVLQRVADHAITSIVSTHMTINPARNPAQPGNPGSTRIQRFDSAGNQLLGLVRTLETFGPVLIGGDMNSRARQGAWTAAQKMATIGYRWVTDHAVMHLFYPGGTKLVSSRVQGIASDHPALFATIDMNEVGPTAQ